jgi:serine phosphatase RsbU (regulator of sigma subunit)
VLLGTDTRSDLLLGVAPETTRHEHEAVVERGSTVLLYTDGLVERRDQVFDEGIARLLTEIAGHGETPVEELVDLLLERMLPDRAEDDVALLAVRLHEQDRPRPDR